MGKRIFILINIKRNTITTRCSLGYSLPYSSLCEGAEYDAKDEVYNIEDLNILCNDFNSIVHSLGGYTSEFETY